MLMDLEDRHAADLRSLAELVEELLDAGLPAGVPDNRRRRIADGAQHCRAAGEFRLTVLQGGDVAATADRAPVAGPPVGDPQPPAIAQLHFEALADVLPPLPPRSEEHTSALHPLMPT